MNILALLQCLEPSLTATTTKQLSRIIQAMLVMSGRVTMLGIARWATTGGSYRTVQRFYATAIPWATLFWVFFREQLWRRGDTYVLAGDEVVVTKAGKQTHGLDRFFSSLYGKTIPGVSFFALSLVSVQERHAYPVSVEQIVRDEAEKRVSKAKATTKKQDAGSAKGKPGRKKGSKNKNKAAVVLAPELVRIKKMVGELLLRIGGGLFLCHRGDEGAFRRARWYWMLPASWASKLNPSAAGGSPATSAACAWKKATSPNTPSPPPPTISRRPASRGSAPAGAAGQPTTAASPATPNRGRCPHFCAGRKPRPQAGGAQRRHRCG
jgi:hypothetical protein